MNIVTQANGVSYADEDLFERLLAAAQDEETEIEKKQKLWSTTGEVLTEKTLKVTRYLDHLMVEDPKKGLQKRVRLFEVKQAGDPHPRYKASLEDLKPFSLRSRLKKTRVMTSIGERTKGIYLNRLVYALEHPGEDIFYDEALLPEDRVEIAHLNQLSFDDSASNLWLIGRLMHLAYDEIPDGWSDEDHLTEEEYLEAELLAA